MTKELHSLHKPTWRVVRILETIAHSTNSLTLSDIAHEIQCPKSTIIPILKTLVDLQYLEINADSLRYSIGKNSALLGNMYLPQTPCLDLIKEQMEMIVSLCGETCHLGVLDGPNIMYLQKVSAPKPIQLISSIGKRLPAYATALGKALLMDYEKADLEKLLSGPYTPITPQTITNMEDLYADIHKDSANGFTYECEEITEHARCIARPLRINGKIVFAISVSFLTFNSDEAHVNYIKAILTKYSVTIEKLITSYDFQH